MFCALLRPRYQVSVYRTIGPLVVICKCDTEKLMRRYSKTDEGSINIFL